MDDVDFSPQDAPQPLNPNRRVISQDEAYELLGCLKTAIDRNSVVEGADWWCRVFKIVKQIDDTERNKA